MPVAGSATNSHGGDGSDVHPRSEDAGDKLPEAAPGVTQSTVMLGTTCCLAVTATTSSTAASGDDVYLRRRRHRLARSAAPSTMWLHGHNVSGAGDQNAVDPTSTATLARNATKRDPAAIGCLARGGNDLLWGEARRRFYRRRRRREQSFRLRAAARVAVAVRFPYRRRPRLRPPCSPAVGITHAGGDIARPASNTQGRWSELAGSGSRDGLSQSLADRYRNPPWRSTLPA